MRHITEPIAGAGAGAATIIDREVEAMRKTGHATRGAPGRRVRPPRALIAGLLLGVVACNNLLDVSIPGSVQASDLDNPGLAQTMVSSALGEFECAYGMYVATTGILSEEYWVSGFTIGVNIWGWRGDAELRATAGECTIGTGSYGYYVPLQRARFLAEDASRRIEGFADAAVPAKTDKLAQLAAYAGYSTLLLGEGFCNMALDNGPRITRTEVFAKAETWFTKAITLATTAGNLDIKNMAFIGRARARLDQGKGALAASDADSVVTGRDRVSEYSAATTRRQNKLFVVTVQGLDLTVAPAYRGLTVGAAAAADTRVAVVNANRKGGDGVTNQFNQQKYTALASTIPLATWKEAQLIMAEVRGGQAAIDAMNRVRTAAGLPQLTAAETADIPGTLVEERRRTLFSEGQRYNDMLRLGIPFPSGFNQKGQAYGSITCLPLPDVETQNNPNLR